MGKTLQSHAVKCLNTGPGKNKYRFKSFREKVEHIDIKSVFRIPDLVALEPKNGSTFFLDALVHWRELNTTEGFISFYEEMMPLVQTLPLILLQKERIVDELLNRIDIKSKLSLEPLLGLLAALSRDITKEFIPYLSRLADSLLVLIKNGGENDSEVLEQVFTYWSHIIMHLQKYLHVVQVLKATRCLRYYPKDYIQRFMAESVSFLMRKAPEDQLEKGIKKVLSEASKDISNRKTGASSLLWHTMRGTSSTLHSRAFFVVDLLFSDYILGTKGSETALMVIYAVLDMLSKNVGHTGLKMVWDCLLQKIKMIWSVNGCILYMSHLLSVLISTFEDNSRYIDCVADLEPVLELVSLLIEKYISPPPCAELEGQSEIVDKTFQLMHHLLGVHCIFDNNLIMSKICLQWAPVFKVGSSSLIGFLRQLIRKDPVIVHPFYVYIISAIDNLMDSFDEVILDLTLTFFKGHIMHQSCHNMMDDLSGYNVSRIYSLLERTVCNWNQLIDTIATEERNSNRLVQTSDLAILWGVLRCYSLFMRKKESQILVKNIIVSLNRLLACEDGNIAGLPRSTWQSILGAALSNYSKVILSIEGEMELSEVSYFLQMAEAHKLSTHVLMPVAEFLDSVLGSPMESLTYETLPELNADRAFDAISVYSDSLCIPNKLIRVSTLKILSHFAPLKLQLSTVDGHPPKKLKRDIPAVNLDSKSSNVIQLLLSVEKESSVTSKLGNIFISRILSDITSGKICQQYFPLLANAIIGIFYIRNDHMQKAARDCLKFLLAEYNNFVWDNVLQCLQNLQSQFLTSKNYLEIVAPSCNANTDLLLDFESYLNSNSECSPPANVLRLLLQSLQKVNHTVESHSQQLMRAFLSFLGYSGDNPISVLSFDQHCCRKAEWQMVLMEWLDLLKSIQFTQSVHSQFLKNVLSSRLLEMDASVQMKVLDCLLNWKDDFLLLYEEHLKTLISLNHMREELTIWNISKESCSIHEDHRVHLIPLIIRLLVPKVRKIKKFATKKHAGALRKAILSFLAQLDVDELSLFFSLLFDPLFSSHFQNSGIHLKMLHDGQSSVLCQSSTTVAVGDLSYKKIYGFLYVADDVLKTFDESRLKPILNKLLIIVVRILEFCSLNLKRRESSRSGTEEADMSVSLDKFSAAETVPSVPLAILSPKQEKELRSLCLRIIAFAVDKYEEYEDTEFWNIFLVSLTPLVERFKEEGSSSEKTTPLLSCLVSMSRSTKFVSLLETNDILPAIISILTVKTSSYVVISSVLKFIENVLLLDKAENNLLKGFIAPHIDTLILSFSSVYKGSQRRLMLGSGKTEIGLLKQLSAYVNRRSTAKLFITAMLQLFKKKNITSAECLEGLHVIKGIIPVTDAAITAEILSIIHPLLISAEPSIRLCICNILDDLALKEPTLILLAEHLRELNATSSKELDELDYDRRIKGYNKIDRKLFYQLQSYQSLVLMSQCVYDISSEDLIVRQSASNALVSFIEFSATVLENDTESCMKPCSASLNKFNDPRDNFSSWTESSIKCAMKKVFLENIGEAMGKGTSAQKEWVLLLREMVLKLPCVLELDSLKVLCSEDPEMDFFNNILHLQVHKRTMALSRFRNAMNTEKFSESLLVKIFVPFFFHMMFDVKDGKGEHLRNAFLESLACISGQLSWGKYHHFLRRCFQELFLKPDKQKLLLRLICSVLDKFNFYNHERDLSQEDMQCDIKVSDKCKEISYDHTSIRQTLQTTFLSKVLTLINSESETLNINLSLVALKLLKLLSNNLMELHLPSIIHRICNFLRNRLESVRDEARAALVTCLKELGHTYLHVIVKVLLATLKRGFELHVLAYTVYYIISKSFSCPVAGSLDSCLEDLLSVVVNDIIGDVSTEKDVEKLASKMNETRKKVSFETVRLISMNITFKTHAMIMLSPIETHLHKLMGAKENIKIRNILHNIAAGLKCNPSVEKKELLIFVYGLIEDNVSPVSLISNKMKVGKGSVCEMVENGDTLGFSDEYSFQWRHMVIVFALNVLENCLKNLKLNGGDPQMMSMLDPFLKLLGKCLLLKYEDVLSSTFKCFCVLLRLPLPSAYLFEDDIKSSVMEILQNMQNSTNLLVESSLKLLIVLLAKISMSKNELHMLIQSPLFNDLQTHPSPLALSLLKQIVSRKLEAPEIYDVITKVAELVISCQLEPIRKKCSHIMLKFLLDYPLSEKHRQQRLNFFLTNLNYVHASGRESVLELLNAMLVKYPQREVDAHAQTIFLHLVLCLANEHDTKVSSMVSTVIKQLINQVGQSALHHIQEYSLSWYKGEKEHLWASSAQVIALMVETSKEGFQEKVYDLLHVVNGILMLSLRSCTNHKVKSLNDATPIHKGAFYSLKMLEKLLLQFPWLYTDCNLKDLWDSICKLLLHPYIQLRNMSSHTVGLYFQNVSEMAEIISGKSNIESMYIMRPCRLFMVAVSFCNQLHSPVIDVMTTNLITQNLAYTIYGLHCFVKNEKRPINQYWSTLDASERSCYIEALELLGFRKIKNSFLLLCTDNNCVMAEETCLPQSECSDDLQSLLVVPLLKKLGKIAILREDSQMKVVFNCYRIIMSKVGCEGCLEYATHVMLPLYKICEGISGKVVTDEAKHFAEEVRDSIRKIIGNEEFVKAYNSIRKKLQEKRNKRKHEDRILEVADPERSAKKKLRKSAKHQIHKKRKIMGLKMMRWSR